MTMDAIIKRIIVVTIFNFTLGSLIAFANEGDEEMGLLTTEEQIEQMQDKVGDARDRYNHAERQYKKWERADDLSDYLGIVEDIEIFN
ncbi:MAG: hypothetical protein ACHP9Y_00800 [Gammaproteobacteria bacterium]